MTNTPPASPSSDPIARRKPNFAIIVLSCLILMLACWNFKRAEEEFHGADVWWDDTSLAWSLPDLTSYAWNSDEERIGVVVLGMHRSGTSMLTGLLATAYGYYTGETEELIPPRSANVKGYFERFDMVRHNDRFLLEVKNSMKRFPPTSILYTPKIIVGYNKHALEPAEMVRRNMDPDWDTALQFLNNEHPIIHTDHVTVPWVQKDPRMCITLRTWLPFLKQPPAVIMTYRHPAEVAHSVATRDKKPMLVGLKAWIAYNTAMIRSAAGLCTVVTKNVDLLRDAHAETQRIVDALQAKCRVLAPPNPQPHASLITRFIDVKLQSARHQELTPCVHGKPYWNVTTTGLRQSSEMVYRKAMNLFCDMESGVAFEPGYSRFPTGY